MTAPVFALRRVKPAFPIKCPEMARFVEASDAQQSFKDAVGRYACRLYSLLERQAGEPWFFGSRFSALDLYLTVMTRWRPRRTWFAEHAPRLFAIATKTEALDRLAAVWRKNFASG